MAAPTRADHPEIIGRRLVALRGALGLTLTEVCKITGIAKNTWSQWESGKQRPQLDFAITICHHSGVTLDWLYFGDPSGLPVRLSRLAALPAAQ